MLRQKFQVQKKTMDFTRHLARVVGETSCSTHSAMREEPCYIIPYGVCDKRARQIFIGQPTERTRQKRSFNEIRA